VARPWMVVSASPLRHIRGLKYTPPAARIALKMRQTRLLQSWGSDRFRPFVTRANGGQNAGNVGNAANAKHAGNGRHDEQHGDSRDAHWCAHWCFDDSSPSAANHFSGQTNSTIKSGSSFWMTCGRTIRTELGCLPSLKEVK